MFTGIVEEVGRVIELDRISDQAIRLRIAAEEVLSDIGLGDSIAVNGICLTCCAFDEMSFSVDVMPETVKSTSLNSMEMGMKVNLERAVQASGRFGGHFVTGHVDGIGRIRSRRMVENALYIEIELCESMMVYLVKKASVAIDGVSLTVFALGQDSITISLIPHTLERTILGEKQIGDVVNIECDLLAKHLFEQLKYIKNT